jgi:hypothetical protein
VEHADQALEGALDVHAHIRVKAARLAEGVGEGQDDRHPGQVRHGGTDSRDDEQVGSVLHEQAGKAMVGVVVSGPVRDHEVRTERANQADDPMAMIEPVVQFAVGDVEDLVGCPDGPRRRVGFGLASSGKVRARMAVVAGSAVGQAHEPDDGPVIAPGRELTHLAQDGGLVPAAQGAASPFRAGPHERKVPGERTSFPINGLT